MYSQNSLPPHANKMVWSVLCTVFCCLLGGIFAIVYSSKSNGLYNSAMFASDPSLQQSLYYQSEQANKTAQTWITISIIAGILGATYFRRHRLVLRRDDELAHGLTRAVGDRS